MPKFERPTEMSDPRSTKRAEDAPDTDPDTTGEENEGAADEEQAEGDDGAEGDQDPGEDAEGEAPESDDEPDEQVDQGDGDADDEPDSGADEVTELRQRLATLESERGLHLGLIERLQRAPSATTPPTQQPKEPDEVEKALAVIYDPKLRKDPTEQKKRFEAFPASVQEAAILRHEAQEERVREFAKDPKKYFREHAREAIAQAITERDQVREEQAFVDEHLDMLNDEKQRSRLALKAQQLAAGTGRPITLAVLRFAAADLKKEQALAQSKRREHKVASKERDERARQNARQARGSRKPDLGGRREQPKFQGETSLRAIRKKAEQTSEE